MTYSTNRIGEALIRAENRRDFDAASGAPERNVSERTAAATKEMMAAKKAHRAECRRREREERMAPQIRPLDIFQVGEKGAYYQVISADDRGVYARWIKRQKCRMADGSIGIMPLPGKFMDGTKNEKVAVAGKTAFFVGDSQGLRLAERVYTAPRVRLAISRMATRKQI